MLVMTLLRLITQESRSQVSQAASVLQTGFRFSDAENFDIANKDKLSYRIFYKEPSKGADAKWFDAVKRGDLATVKYMVTHGKSWKRKILAILIRQR